MPTSTASPTTRPPVSRSTPITARMRKSPRPNAARCSSMATPRWRPEASSSRSSGRPAGPAPPGGRAPAGRPARRARCPGALVTIIGRPTGRQPCETIVLTAVRRRQHHAHPAVADDLAVEDEAVAARRPGAGGEAAGHRHPGLRGVDRVEDRLDRQAERVGQQQDRGPLGQLAHGQALDGGAARRAGRGHPHGLERSRRGQGGGPQAEGRALLDLVLAADHRVGGASRSGRGAGPACAPWPRCRRWRRRGRPSRTAPPGRARPPGPPARARRRRRWPPRRRGAGRGR